MTKLKVEYLSPAELQPYANNAKLHPAEQIEQIKRSIEEFGFNDPIAIWKNDEIIEGHGRLIAALELGLDEVPVIRLDDLTDEERRAYMLVHNKLTMNSDFDADVLDIELNDLTIDMSEFGFSLLDEDESKERKEVAYKENISVVIECEDEEDAERIFNELTGEGYTCRISTL